MRNVERTHNKLARDLNDRFRRISEVFGRVEPTYMSLTVGTTLALEDTPVDRDPVVESY